MFQWRTPLNNLWNLVRICGEGSVIALTFIEVLGIKDYSNDFVIMNTNESSTSSPTNYVGLVILATKPNTNICGKSIDFGFMWLPNHEKLSSNVKERFRRMVVDVKATIIAPL